MGVTPGKIFEFTDAPRWVSVLFVGDERDLCLHSAS